MKVLLEFYYKGLDEPASEIETINGGMSELDIFLEEEIEWAREDHMELQVIKIYTFDGTNYIYLHKVEVTNE